MVTRLHAAAFTCLGVWTTSSLMQKRKLEMELASVGVCLFLKLWYAIDYCMFASSCNPFIGRNYFIHDLFWYSWFYSIQETVKHLLHVSDLFIVSILVSSKNWQWLCKVVDGKTGLSLTNLTNWIFSYIFNTNLCDSIFPSVS